MTVFVVGNVTEDLVFSVPRLPRAGETLIAGRRLQDIGGKGLNQALLLAQAGCEVCLIAAIGDDAAGARARALALRDMPASRLLTVAAPTDQSIIAVAEDGENHIISTAAAADALTPEAAADALGGVSADDAVLVQGNLTAATTEAALSAARDAGALTIANPSPIRWDWARLVQLCDLLVLNRAELRELGGAPETLRALGAQSVLLTLGPDGAALVDDHGEARAPAAPVDAVDSAGAGDTYLAIFLAARLRGADRRAALTAAARGAAITVSRPGTSSAFPTAAEIARCLADAGAAA